MLNKNVVTQLRAAGLKVVELPGWETFSADSRSFTPYGVMNHHTASSAGSLSDSKLAMLVREHKSYNILVGRDGVVFMIAAGRMWHAGRGMGEVAERSRLGMAPEGYAKSAGTTNGNTFYYGVSIANAGTRHKDGSEVEPVPEEQWEALVIVNAVLQKFLGHTNANTSIHHREWTSRKVDLLAEAPVLRAAIEEAMVDSKHLTLKPGSFRVEAPVGYYFVQPDGGVFGMEAAKFHGSLPGLGISPDAPIIDAVVTDKGDGYYLLASDGGIFGFGNAPYVGSLVGLLDARGKPIAIDIVDNRVVVYGDTLNLSTGASPVYLLGEVK